MALLPIIERELRVSLRKKRPVRRRLQVAALAVGGTLLFLLLSAVAGQRGAGHTLHQLLCLVAGYLVLRTPRLTAGIFAEERREQTLGLLFLSGLGATEVFASKLLDRKSTRLNSSHSLHDALPISAHAPAHRGHFRRGTARADARPVVPQRPGRDRGLCEQAVKRGAGGFRRFAGPVPDAGGSVPDWRSFLRAVPGHCMRVSQLPALCACRLLAGFGPHAR